MIVLEVLILLITLPFRLWCLITHRRFWTISPLGWSWCCVMDGFEWPFSRDDVKKIIG